MTKRLKVASPANEARGVYYYHSGHFRIIIM